MNVPLEIIRDDHGRLRDVNDQAIIIVFNTKPKRPRTSRRSFPAKEKLRTVQPQSFAFINISKPDERFASLALLVTQLPHAIQIVAALSAASIFVEWVGGAQPRFVTFIKPTTYVILSIEPARNLIRGRVLRSATIA
jgi:hypothetical protein